MPTFYMLIANYLSWKICIINLAFLFFLVLIGCSKADKSVDVCKGLIDTVAVIDQKNINSNTYFLVLRLAGLQDKTEIFEIYDRKPTFDVCGDGKIQPLVGNTVDSKNFDNNDQFVESVNFNVSQNIMEIKYSIGRKNKSNNKNVKLMIE